MASYRKYRVMMIGGWLYPLHLAISPNWKIHYVTADMADNAGHRAEEAKFLEDMPGVLGPRAMAALAEIQNVLGLDYAGVDFGLNAAGDVLLFEANATMTVLPPERDRRWDYRRDAVQRIEDAVRKMIVDKARLFQLNSSQPSRAYDILAASSRTGDQEMLNRLILFAHRRRCVRATTRSNNPRRHPRRPPRCGPENAPAPAPHCFFGRPGKQSPMAASTPSPRNRWQARTWS